MGVYKEAMHMVATLNKMQEQVYPDACDYGIKVSSFNDKSIIMAKQLIEMYGREDKVRKEDRYGNDLATVTIKLIMIDEYGDGSEFPVVLTYNKVRERNRKNRMIGILSIDPGKWEHLKPRW